MEKFVNTGGAKLKTRKYCKQFVLLILLFFLTGCLGGSVSTFNPTITDIKVPTIPASLTSDVVAASLRTLNYNSSDWGPRGEYTVIPQISINYNKYMDDQISDLLTKMITLTPESEKLRIGGHLTSVLYEKIDHNVFDRKITFIDADTDNIQAVFYANQTGSRLNLVIRYNEEEVRQVIFESRSGEKHALVLFYRRDAAQMNDIVEIWETNQEIQTKCVRVYDLDQPEDEHKIIKFGAFTYKKPLAPTTARYFQRWGSRTKELVEISNSPAIFNEDAKYIRSLNLGSNELEAGYPTIGEATKVYEKGIDYGVVQNALVDQESLESNLLDLID